MNSDLSLNHSRWECKYHVVWIPKYRKKTLYGQIRKYLGQVLKELARNRAMAANNGWIAVKPSE
jgi:putative transposase